MGLLTLFVAKPYSIEAQTINEPLSISISQVVPRDWPMYDLYVSICDANAAPITIAQLGVPLTVSHVDGSPVRINRIERTRPIYSILIVDISGSMSKPAKIGQMTKLEAVKRAIERYIERMRSQDFCAIIPFATEIPSLDKIHFLQKNDAALLSEISKLAPGGCTLLYDAIDRSLDFINKENLKARTPVIVMTDGYNNIVADTGEVKGRLEGENGLRTILSKAAGIRIDTVGFGDPNLPRPERGSPEYMKNREQYMDSEVLMRLCKQTGGDAYLGQDPSTMGDFYERLMALYQAEFVITCQDDTLRNDIDPSIIVQCSPRAEKLYSSNPVNISFLLSHTPPFGHPSYRQYALKRMSIFSASMLFILFLWLLPNISLRRIISTQSHQQQMRTSVSGWRLPADVGTASTCSTPTPNSPDPRTFWEHQTSGTSRRQNLQGSSPPHSQPPPQTSPAPPQPDPSPAYPYFSSSWGQITPLSNPPQQHSPAPPSWGDEPSNAPNIKIDVGLEHADPINEDDRRRWQSWGFPPNP